MATRVVLRVSAVMPAVSRRGNSIGIVLRVAVGKHIPREEPRKVN